MAVTTTISASTPTVLALDFDGVLCDGLKEYFLAAWHAYCALWQPDSDIPPDGLAAMFYRLRPVVETGWEMPLLLRALLLGMDESDILRTWGTIAPQLAQAERVEPSQLAAAVDGVRDRWIATNLDRWLAEHAFYPGVIERLKALLDSPIRPVIISTKERRFIVQLLEQQAIPTQQIQIFGKETKRPKHQILRELMATGNDTYWFIEDRLKTLDAIRQQPDLAAVRLFLADWGYNTQAERDRAANDPAIGLLSLNQFSQGFSAWLE